MMIAADDQERWLPIAFSIKSKAIAVHWMSVCGKSFNEPFFSQTLHNLRAKKPPAAERTTDFTVLLECAAERPENNPCGIIFHVSRCGSTLLTNVLRTGVDVLALSEAEPFECFFNQSAFANATLSDEEKIRARRIFMTSVVKLYAHRSESENHKVVIKCYATSMTQISLARSIWPDVPFIVLIRDPLEVMISNLEKPAHWMMSRYKRMRNRGLLGLTVNQLENMSGEEYCARAIGSFYEAAIKEIDGHCLVVDYSDINIACYHKIADLLKIQMPHPDSAEFKRVLSTYSKDVTGTRGFESDCARKQSDAPDSIRKLAERFAREPYVTLKNASLA